MCAKYWAFCIRLSIVLNFAGAWRRSLNMIFSAWMKTWLKANLLVLLSPFISSSSSQRSRVVWFCWLLCKQQEDHFTIHLPHRRMNSIWRWSVFHARSVCVSVCPFVRPLLRLGGMKQVKPVKATAPKWSNNQRHTAAVLLLSLSSIPSHSIPFLQQTFRLFLLLLSLRFIQTEKKKKSRKNQPRLTLVLRRSSSSSSSSPSSQTSAVFFVRRGFKKFNTE